MVELTTSGNLRAARNFFFFHLLLIKLVSILSFLLFELTSIYAAGFFFVSSSRLAMAAFLGIELTVTSVIYPDFSPTSISQAWFPECFLDFLRWIEFFVCFGDLLMFFFCLFFSQFIFYFGSGKFSFFFWLLLTPIFAFSLLVLEVISFIAFLRLTDLSSVMFYFLHPLSQFSHSPLGDRKRGSRAFVVSFFIH